MNRRQALLCLSLPLLPATGYSYSVATMHADAEATARAGATGASPSTAKIVTAARAFLATLTASQRKTIQFSFSDSAQKARWSNFPDGIFSRAGLMWGAMTAKQRQAWLAVTAATLSPEGYRRVLQEWHADQALAASQGSGGNGPGNVHFGTAYYYIALLGTPSTTAP